MKQFTQNKYNNSLRKNIISKNQDILATSARVLTHSSFQFKSPLFYSNSPTYYPAPDPCSHTPSSIESRATNRLPFSFLSQPFPAFVSLLQPTNCCTLTIVVAIFPIPSVQSAQRFYTSPQSSDFLRSIFHVYLYRKYFFFT